MSRRGSPLPAGFGAIWTTVAIDLVGFGIVLPILPLYAERYGASATTIGLLVASFSVAQLACAPLLGWVSDRIGRKPVLLISLMGTAAGSLLTALAPTLGVLFAGRIVDGMSGASVSVAQAAVVDLARADQRARLLGLLSAAFGVGFVAGPALGGLAALADPRLPFVLAALIAAVNALYAYRRLPETHQGAAGDGPARLAAPTRSRQPVILAGVAFAAIAAFAAFETTFALLGERRLGFSLGTAGAVFALAGAVVALSSAGLVHPLTARLGELKTLGLALALNSVGLLGLAGATSWWLVLTALAAVATGQGLVTPSLAALVGGGATRQRRGTALGVQQAAAGLGRVVGPILGGVAFGVIGPGGPMAAAAVLTAVAALVLSVLARNVPERTSPIGVALEPAA